MIADVGDADHVVGVRSPTGVDDNPVARLEPVDEASRVAVVEDDGRDGVGERILRQTHGKRRETGPEVEGDAANPLDLRGSPSLREERLEPLMELVHDADGGCERRLAPLPVAEVVDEVEVHAGTGVTGNDALDHPRRERDAGEARRK